MLFKTIHTYHFPVRKEELKSRLVGRHVNIHNLDFEVLDKDPKLTIIPHAEEIESIKTLPITSVVFDDEGNTTKVVVTSRMRQIDSGGPILIVAFCAFILVASFLMLKYREPNAAYTLMGISLLILTLFCIRLQTGYFDYVRKVHSYIKSKADALISVN
jgi:hypothetical protein